MNQSHRSLVEQLRVAGLAVKRAEAQAIDLASGVACHWLGFTIHWRDGRLIYDLPSDWQDEMRASLTNCHARAYSTENARASILGWCRAYGPVWATTGRRSVYLELVTLAADCGFREIPAAHEFVDACRKASQAWCRHRQALGLAGLNVTCRRAGGLKSRQLRTYRALDESGISLPTAAVCRTAASEAAPLN